ncbi:MAG: hypothetical protein HFG22_16550 [Lachnospiraceae bacterium]|nr:hypothetical protein [Lachnospiraceae bacterium]
MDNIIKAMGSILDAVLQILPDSPFRPFIDSLGEVPYVGWLNYFLPVSDFLRLLTLWGTAIVLFYAVSALLRFVQAID